MRPAQHRRSVVLCLALGLTTLLAPSGAVAATEVGATFQPNSTCASTGYTYVQSTSPGGQYAAGSVDGQVPRNISPRIRSGPEGSSLKR